MKKILSIVLVLALVFSMAACGGDDSSSESEPPREFQDAFFETEAKTEEVYNSNDDWTIYYEDATWEDYLFNVFMLYAKGYDLGDELEDQPQWFYYYTDSMYLEKPEGEDSVTMTATLDGWQTLEATYYFENDENTPDGMNYNMKLSVVELGQDFLDGKEAPEIDADLIEYYTYEDYLDIKNRRAGDEPDLPRIFSDEYTLETEIEEHYNSNTDWVLYYNEANWEEFLMYTMVLSLKGYEFDDDPEYIQEYLDTMAIDVPFDPVPESVTLYAEKENWQRLKIEYFFTDDMVSPDGMPYKIKISVVELYEDVLNGVPGDGLEYEQYGPYVEKRDERKAAEENANDDTEE